MRIPAPDWFVGWGCGANDPANGEVGSGLWPLRSPKLSRVGVAVDGSSAMVEGCGCDCGWTGARGVVGVVTAN